MRIDPVLQLPAHLCEATANLLNRFTLFCLPDHRRVWGEALIAEREQIRTPYERLVWAAGGVSMTANEFLKNAFGDGASGEPFFHYGKVGTDSVSCGRFI